MSILFATAAAPIVASTVVAVALVWMSRTPPRKVRARRTRALTTLESGSSRPNDLEPKPAAQRENRSFTGTCPVRRRRGRLGKVSSATCPGR